MRLEGKKTGKVELIQKTYGVPKRLPRRRMNSLCDKLRKSRHDKKQTTKLRYDKKWFVKTARNFLCDKLRKSKYDKKRAANSKYDKK